MVYINADGMLLHTSVFRTNSLAGTVKEERSKVRLSLISDIFWTIFDVVGIIKICAISFFNI